MSADVRIVDIAVVLAGLVGLVWMGCRLARSNKTADDYFLGNRAIPGWLIGVSLVGTLVSSITFLALPAAAFALDWRLIVNNLMLPLGIVMAVLVFIPLFRRGRITTAFEYLGRRFCMPVRVYGAVSFVILQLLRLSTVLYLVSLPISLLLGVPVVWAIILVGAFISVYTLFGGFRAVIWTDLIQTVVLVGGGLLCLGLIIHALPGGVGQIVEIGRAEDKFSLGDFDWDFARRTFWTMVLLGIFQWITGYASDQTVIQRYLAASSTREARRAVLICGAMSIPLWALFFFLGTALYAYYAVFASPLVATMAADEVLPYFLQTEVLVGVTGLIILGVLAAAMSTLDSGINSISTVVVMDLWKLLRRRSGGHSLDLQAARLASGCAGLIMIVGALVYHVLPRESILDMQVIVTALFGGCLGGLFMIGIFTTRVGNGPVIVGIVIAILLNSFLVLNQLGWLPESWALNLHAYWVGMTVNLVFVVFAYGLSWFMGRRQDGIHGLTVWTMGARSEEAIEEHNKPTMIE
jgi:SSS family solute:Na+ symporter